MLSRSDTDIVASMQYFAPFEVNVAFLVPTQTGYEKSIMDATSPVRSLLKEAGLHDYEMQGQGEENKKTVKAFLVYSGATEEVRCSLYRPVTKHGVLLVVERLELRQVFQQLLQIVSICLCLIFPIKKRFIHVS